MKKPDFKQLKFVIISIAATSILTAVAIQAYNINEADAQSRLPNNSVRSENIVDGQVKTQDLADDAVTRDKIKDGEVTSNEIHDADITAQDIAEGTILGGNIKDETIQAQDIAEGTIQLNTHVLHSGPHSLPSMTGEGRSLSCPSGEILISGGFRGSITESRPSDDGQIWNFAASNNTPQDQFYHIYILCAAPSP